MKWFVFIFFCYLTLPSQAQVLVKASQQEFVLANHQRVYVLASEDCGHCYYYLPMNFRLSSNRNNQPEVSFTSWKNDENSETVGAIFHFLTVWGLTQNQEIELQNKLKERLDTTAYIMGAASLEVDPEHMYLEFEGKAAVVQLLNNALTSSARVATTPGSKMALSFRFDESNVNSFLEMTRFPRKLKTDLIVNFIFSSKTNYQYKKEQIVLSLPFESIIKQLSN